MKLTKKLEAEILKIYHTYWDAYLKGDMKTFATFLDNNVTVYGTAMGEVFKTKNEVIRFYKATADQMTGKAEMRKRKIALKVIGTSVLIYEQFDLYVLAEKKWMFYGHVRLTSMVEQKEKLWKVVLQHASFPDSRTEEGEQIATEKIKTENLQLREAVQRRTIELETKNRELEIETALEKVRTVAMAMKKADDMLSVCKTISQQLAQLGVKEIRNVQTAIFYESRGTYMNYEYYAKHDKTFITEVDYKNHKIQLAFAKKMMKGKNEEVLEHLKGKKLQDWYTYQKSTNQFADKYLLKAHSLNYYWYSLGPVALGISAYYPLTKDETDLFKRFLKVFELAYRRYLDIEQATAQVRQAQIEASLEKVRAQALGMRKPEELTNVCEVLFKELQALGFAELRNAMVNIHNDKKRIFVNYDYSDEIGKSITPLFYDIHPVIKKQIRKIRSADDAFSETVFKGKDLASWKAFRKSRGEKDDKRIKNSTALYYYFYSIGTGSIGISTFNQIAAENQELLKRFRNVFVFAYRRYMDVAQAEAQAREAQIEVALERIRAASLAMMDSSALSGIIYKLYGELTKLDAKLDRCFIMIVNPENKGITWWMAGQEGLLAENGFFVQMNEHPSHLMYLNYCKQRKKKWTYLFQGKEKRDWDRFGFSKSELAKLPEPVKTFMAAAKAVHLSGSSDQFGSLVTGSFEPLPEEQQDIISRFTIAFNQAYIRFLDLQKAEAQAREAAIELGLERVRARTMAMQNSEELAELVSVVFKELTQLDFVLTSCIIWINDTQTLTNTLWVTSAEMNKPVEPVRLKPFHHSFFHSILHAWKEKDAKWIYTMTGKEKTSFEKTFFANEPRMPLALKKALSVPKKVVFSASFNNFGALEIIATEPLTDEKFDILHRFGKVFDSSYTRFNDLKLAEAQAREAQIEAALERVRARTMAMQQSNELPEAANLLFKQVQSMGMPAWSAGYCIWDDNLPAGQAGKQGITLWMSSEGVMQPSFHAPLTKDPSFIHMREAYEKGQTFHVEEVGGKELVKHYKYMRTLPVVGKILDSIIEAGHPLPTFQIFHCVYFSQGFLLFITYEPVQEAHEIFKRFGKVFDQTYTRFLDLQKAEAQAREAQIELALERVRAKAMAMHSSSDLLETISVFYRELKTLSVTPRRCGVALMDTDERMAEVTTMNTTEQGDSIEVLGHIRMRGHKILDDVYENWLRQKEYHAVLRGNQIKEYYQVLKPQISYPDYPHDVVQYGYYFMFNEGDVYAWTEKELTEDELKIYRRFTTVISLTYKRYKDLQKAEAQTREAQIELGLERVRARAMAMQKSDELSELVDTVFKELTKLDFALNWCIINIIDAPSLTNMVWAANPETNKPPESYLMKFEDYPFHHSMMKGYQERKTKHVYVIEGKEKKTYDDYLFNKTEWRRVPKAAQDASRAMKRYVATFTFSNFGGLQTVGEEYLSEENLEILSRFGKVFDLTYTRFNDLQKAETQAREAQIEAALERVRSRSMAMHKSDELLEAGEILFLEMQKLGIESLTAGFVLMDKEEKNGLNYTPDPSTKKMFPLPVIIPHDETIHMQQVVENWKKGRPYYVVEMDEEETIKHQTFIAERSTNFTLNAAQLIAISPPRLYLHNFYFKEGYLLIVGGHKLSAEQTDIMLRFTKVFQQTYTRFLDLQKAEAQAREAKIEVALEKVRSRTMAMQKSDELGDVATVLFKEMNQLVENLWTCGFILCEKDRAEDEWWLSTESGFIPAFYLPNTGDRVHENLFTGWKNGEVYRTEQIEGAELDQHYEWLMNIPVTKKIFDDMAAAGFQKPIWQKLHASYFSKGYLCIITREPCPEEDVFKRFAQVFDLTYTRFLDLQKAEFQTRQAKIETALEKVRARALAMQQPEELTEVAQVMRHEMGMLGVEELETSSIYIHDDVSDNAECWYAIKDSKIPEKKLVADHFKLNLQETWVGRQMYSFYHSKEKQISIPMQGKNRKEWINYCSKQSKLLDGFYGEVIPDRTYHLYKFSNGTIGAATPGNISSESWDLLQRAAAVFSLAYSRFKDLTQARIDLQKLKEEKQRAEDALTELQVTQKQLIQAEKMASLGELTAGIAHEIQNPLNFVNNFSEVSKELLDEMRDAIEKGDTEEAKEIMNDVIQNLEKINHHGKRADGIVKGMLQHSSSGSGKKEPTDINALADEYLRLAYHGLRAKDKSFNATMKTDFDETIGKINIIPQDIGRVILNLITNAFYAAPLPHEGGFKDPNYKHEPTIWVKTSKTPPSGGRGAEVLISVKDNGPGIPQKILDKIFQPFFTTKPTGQGTGLGLSLSYDIVKAHGGELKVNTKEGEGSEFIISLPLHQ
jgi:signal transduction histidine kinase/DNA-directed RNA polymerase subunit N (RpoN/RPB10)